MSDKLIIDVSGVIKMSMQFFPALIDIGSKSGHLHGASRTGRHTSSAVTQVRFYKTILKCEGKEPSETDKVSIDVIGVIRMSYNLSVNY